MVQLHVNVQFQGWSGEFIKPDQYGGWGANLASPPPWLFPHIAQSNDLTLLNSLDFS